MLSLNRWMSLGVVALALARAAPVGAQRDDRDYYRTRIDTVLAFDRRGTVDLSLTSGEIRIAAWDRSQVKLTASSDRGLLRLDASSSRVGVSVRSYQGSTGDTRYELMVPLGTRVLARSVSGDIAVRSVKGEVELRSTSGDIIIDDATGRVEVGTVSGRVEASRIDGDLKGSAVSGDFSVEGVSGEVELGTVSGDVELRGVRSKYIRSRTTSGDLTYEGAIEPGGRYEFHSHSGEVRLTVPSNTGADVSIETFSGEIDSDFPMTLNPGEQHRRRRMDLRIGNGGARIVAETFSGNIEIRRATRR